MIIIMLTYVGFELDNQRKGDDMSNSRYTDSEYYQIDSAGNPTPVVYKPDSDQEGGEGGYAYVQMIGNEEVAEWLRTNS